MDSQEAAFDGLERVIGIEDEGRPGPLVLLVAGLHGNEPGGVAALLQLFDELDGVETAGRVVGLAGNLGALRARKRHLGVDLNRMWTADNIRALGVRPPKDDLPDEAELRALFLTVEAERTAAAAIGRDVVLVDLHSTSGSGSGFSVLPDAVPARRLARAIGLPAVLGLEDRIEGPMLTWCASQGDTAIVVEGGQHDAPTTRTVLHAATLLALDHLGVLPENHAGIEDARRLIDRTRGDAPRVLEINHTHHIPRGERFAMDPGWFNFRPVRRGEPLAHAIPSPDVERVVTSPASGYMLMPLYQEIGDEGFFLCRRVRRTWLVASRLVRRKWIERALVVLPGVRSIEVERGRVEVRRGAGPWLARLLRVFGYRRHSPSGASTAWFRRAQ